MRIGADRRIDGVEQGVAVGCGPGNVGRADVAGGADPVLDHDLLTPHLGKLRADPPPHDVGRRGGREWNDQPHELVGIGALRVCSKRTKGEKNKREFVNHGSYFRLKSARAFRVVSAATSWTSRSRARATVLRMCGRKAGSLRRDLGCGFM